MQDYRNKGLASLRNVLSKEQNITTIEKYLYAKCDEDEDIYKLILYQTINDINSGIKLTKILENIKNNKINWNHPCFETEIFEETEQNNFIINPFEVSEGVLTCKCGSSRVYSYQKQSRSADEPMSTYATCMQCKSKWVYSG
jgi:hypothetical protein